MIIEALATRRLTQLVTEDEITRPVREQVQHWANRHPENSWQDRLGYLADCPACASVWCAALVLIARRFRPGRLVLGVLALSGASLIIQAITQQEES